MSWRNVAARLQCAALVFLPAPIGCGGDARMELSAADALQAVADQMALTVEEYHAEVARYDETRDASVVAAFVTRIRQDADDDAATAQHVAEFESALRRIRDDRETEWARRTAALENVGVCREVARGLQRLAIESLTLQDEMRRYLDTWIEARRRAQGTAGAGRQNAGTRAE